MHFPGVAFTLPILPKSKIDFVCFETCDFFSCSFKSKTEAFCTLRHTISHTKKGKFKKMFQVLKELKCFLFKDIRNSPNISLRRFPSNCRDFIIEQNHRYIDHCNYYFGIRVSIRIKIWSIFPGCVSSLWCCPSRAYYKPVVKYEFKPKVRMNLIPLFNDCAFFYIEGGRTNVCNIRNISS